MLIAVCFEQTSISSFWVLSGAYVFRLSTYCYCVCYYLLEFLDCFVLIQMLYPI